MFCKGIPYQIQSRDSMSPRDGRFSDWRAFRVLYALFSSPTPLLSSLVSGFLRDLQERRRKTSFQPERVPNPEGELVKLISLRERSQQSWNGLSKEKSSICFAGSAPERLNLI